MPVPKAVFKLALPTVLSMIVAVLYNMVDAFFVGLIGDPSQFAAVNVATPVFLILMAAKNSMQDMMAGTIVNIILDQIFILMELFGHSRLRIWFLLIAIVHMQGGVT